METIAAACRGFLIGFRSTSADRVNWEKDGPDRPEHSLQRCFASNAATAVRR
jgi:hypothetical protein